MEHGAEIRFVAENTLGKLAKWLRLLGFDTLYESNPHPATDPLPDRIRLTRRRCLRTETPNVPILVIESDHCHEQVRQVIGALGVRPDALRPFTRCLRCNVPLETADKAAVWGKVPDYVWETRSTFRSCPGCGRIYWRGSHTEHAGEKVRRLFGLA